MQQQQDSSERPNSQGEIMIMVFYTAALAAREKKSLPSMKTNWDLGDRKETFKNGQSTSWPGPRR